MSRRRLRPERGLADVIREIAAEQRSRGFPGRSAEDLRADADADADAQRAEDAERERELDAAPAGPRRGSRECCTTSTRSLLSTRSRATPPASNAP